MTCLIKNQEYRTLQKKSGIPDDKFYDICSKYADEHDGRLPELDEIDGANSEQAIKSELGLNKFDTITEEELLHKTRTESVEAANAAINKTYKDRNTEIVKLPNSVMVLSQPMPPLYNAQFRQDFIPINRNSAPGFFSASINRLLTKYGYQLKEVNGKQVNEMGIEPTAKAFILNGDIYVNTDIATIDSPVHELMHIMLGSLRFDAPELYASLVNSAESFQDYAYWTQQFPNRTRMDVNEEIFVEQLALFLTGQYSAINNLSGENLYQIKRSLYRMLDILLMGDVSTKIIDEATIVQMPLRMIANWVQSSLMENEYPCTINPKNALLNRKLANLKSSLLKSGDLIEQCI